MQTILVVDDEPAICVLLERVLSRAGFAVLTAGCGCDAITISQAHRGEIALLVTDTTLPGMTGWNLARELTRAAPNIPVLFLSGGCSESQFEDPEQSEFLPKPFLMSTFLMEVYYLLTEKGRREVD
jgi:two-component system cell cycle sensor histidine kinase/response regulator CckA